VFSSVRSPAVVARRRSRCLPLVPRVPADRAQRRVRLLRVPHGAACARVPRASPSAEDVRNRLVLHGAGRGRARCLRTGASGRGARAPRRARDAVSTCSRVRSTRFTHPACSGTGAATSFARSPTQPLRGTSSMGRSCRRRTRRCISIPSTGRCTMSVLSTPLSATGTRTGRRSSSASIRSPQTRR
jgi:hypothetical protein